MSEGEVSLGLTAQQVAAVIAAVACSGRDTSLLAGLKQPHELSSSGLLNDRTVSRSLLLGLAVLVAFPEDGGDRGIKEIAGQLRMPSSTTHRYVRTLLAVGLLERDRSGHRYRRARRLLQEPGG